MQIYSCCELYLRVQLDNNSWVTTCCYPTVLFSPFCHLQELPHPHCYFPVPGISREKVKSSPHVHPLHTCHLGAIYLIRRDAHSWVVCASVQQAVPSCTWLIVCRWSRCDFKERVAEKGGPEWSREYPRHLHGGVATVWSVASAARTHTSVCLCVKVQHCPALSRELTACQHPRVKIPCRLPHGARGNI